MRTPNCIAIDGEGNVVVGYSSILRGSNYFYLQMFDSSMKSVIHEFGTYEQMGGTPSSVAIDGDGNIYVAVGSSKIMVFG